MSCWYAIQSWLHEGLGQLHVNIPTHSSRTHGNQQAPDQSCVKLKNKMGRQNFKLVLVERVQNIAVMPTAKY